MDYQDCNDCGTTFSGHADTCPTCGATVKVPSAKDKIRAELDRLLAEVGDPSFFEAAIEAVRDMVLETLSEGSDQPNDGTIPRLEALSIALNLASMAADRYTGVYWGKE